MSLTIRRTTRDTGPSKDQLSKGEPVTRKIEIVTLRTSCPDNRICPSIHAITDEPHRRYVITKKVTDPAVNAAFTHLVGEDEQLGYVPTELIPEVSQDGP